MGNYNLDTFDTTTLLGRPPAAVDIEAPRLRQTRLWFVDDNAQVRDLFVNLFRGEADFECEQEFSTTAAALEALNRETAPEVILLDLQLRDENGLDAIRPMKTLAPATDVIMLTTFSDLPSAARAFVAGASGFLLKTYDPQEIVRLVRQTQENPGAPGLFPEFIVAKKPESPRGATRGRLATTPTPAQGNCRRNGRNFFRGFLNVFTF